MSLPVNPVRVPTGVQERLAETDRVMAATQKLIAECDRSAARANQANAAMRDELRLSQLLLSRKRLKQRPISPVAP